MTKERVTVDRHRRAMADAVAASESKFGPITIEELEAQERADRATARVVRGDNPSDTPPRRVHRRGAKGVYSKGSS